MLNHKKKKVKAASRRQHTKLPDLSTQGRLHVLEMGANVTSALLGDLKGHLYLTSPVTLRDSDSALAPLRYMSLLTSSPLLSLHSL